MTARREMKQGNGKEQGSEGCGGRGNEKQAKDMKGNKEMG